MGALEIDSFIAASTFSFEELKELGQTGFPTLDALVTPSQSIVMPWGRNEYLNPGVIPPPRDMWDYIVDKIERAQENTMIDLLQPSVKYPGATRLADLREESEIAILEGRFQISIKPIDLVRKLSALFGKPEPRDLPESVHLLTLDVPMEKVVITITGTAPYSKFSNEKQRLKKLYSSRLSSHGLLALSVLGSLAQGTPLTDDDIKMYADLYDVDKEKMRRNYELFSIALDHYLALDNVALATRLELGWNPAPDKRKEIQSAMLQIAQPALDAGIVISEISYNSFLYMDLPPEPDAVPYPEPEGGGSIKA
jgi:hypothetical protein